MVLSYVLVIYSLMLTTVFNKSHILEARVKLVWYTPTFSWNSSKIYKNIDEPLLKETKKSHAYAPRCITVWMLLEIWKILFLSSMTEKFQLGKGTRGIIVKGLGSAACLVLTGKKHCNFSLSSEQQNRCEQNPLSSCLQETFKWRA